MGFTYAVQVSTGRELNAKKMILDLLERLGNPGILTIHALETFEQTLGNNGMSSKKWKAKLSGYIFVTTASCSADLRMDAKCWQLIKQIPIVRNILNHCIGNDEWSEFFENVDREPEVQILDIYAKQKVRQKKKLKEYWNDIVDRYDVYKKKEGFAMKPSNTIEPAESSEPEPEESSLVAIVETAAEVLRESKEQAVAALRKVVIGVETLKRGNQTLYAMPYKLYKILLNKYHKEAGEARPMSVQIALGELNTLLKAVIAWAT